MAHWPGLRYRPSLLQNNIFGVFRFLSLHIKQHFCKYCLNKRIFKRFWHPFFRTIFALTQSKDKDLFKEVRHLSKIVVLKKKSDKFPKFIIILISGITSESQEVKPLNCCTMYSMYLHNLQCLINVDIKCSSYKIHQWERWM